MNAIQLPHIDDIKPLQAEDQACLDEVKAVLQKHGKLGRFGLNLLHDHFYMAEDEILAESCDEENRILTMKPVKITKLADINYIETNWRLDINEATVACTRI